MDPSSSVTPIGQTSTLSLAVLAPNGARYVGSLVQFTGGTMTAHFWGEEIPALGLGVAMEIQLQGLSLELPTLPAIPLERHELPGGRSYKFGFTLTPEFQDRIPKHLQALFPFRELHRVKPLALEPVGLQMAGEHKEDWFEGQVMDLSTGGLGVLVDRETEQTLCLEHRIRMVLRFPCLGEDALSKVTAFPQHRRMEGQKVHWGMALDTRMSGEWADANALGQYIIKREHHGA